MGLMDFFKGLASSPAVLPHFFKIPNENTPDPGALEGVFETRQNYFTVRVNEMYLLESRKWFTRFEPMVICLTEYGYNKGNVENPFVVGSNLLKTKIKGDGEGMIFRDTRVAGLHPYAGGRFVINIALYSNEIENYLQKSMKLLENISGVFNENITVFLKSFTRISNVIINGIDELIATEKTRPLFGIRKEFDPAANESFSPGYYVMIDKSDKNWEPARFFVDKDNSLKYKDGDNQKNFREDEFILFSIIKSNERNDYESLPVYKSYDDILEYAKGFPEIGEEEKKKIKDMLRVLNFDMVRSPDLTEPDATRLMNKFFTKVKETVDTRFNWGAGVKVAEKDFLSDIDAKIVSM